MTKLRLGGRSHHNGAHVIFSDNPLQPYGNVLETYWGNGQLTLSSERKVNCQFVAGQLETGKTFILCATPDSLIDQLSGLATPILFDGTTRDGYQVKVDHIVSETKYLPEATSAGAYIALRVGHLNRSSLPKAALLRREPIWRRDFGRSRSERMYPCKDRCVAELSS